ncbi:GNAT family N-acetyltransferase [Saccharospirillum impatiens]|uniref:GNAT family N-acetyltransferase n=1 Tax=Saccharospirillum impatiens TaxID=169438 RepID=UPI000408C7EB|nr:GNAT family N-acetyltransferase [Saccharospirillum impatiens]
MTTLHFRKTENGDVTALFDVRSKTRENPISTARLAEMGVTHASTVEGLETGQLCSWVCLSGPNVVGFCTGHLPTGEVLVLAVLPEFEGQGIGKQLLGNVVDAIQQGGTHPIWLSADSNATVKAHGFYRRLGWVPSGQTLGNGDEVLELDSPHK